jgi:hypothetical protein
VCPRQCGVSGHPGQMSRDIADTIRAAGDDAF